MKVMTCSGCGITATVVAVTGLLLNSKTVWVTLLVK